MTTIPRWILIACKYHDPKSTITKKSEEENLKKDNWIPTIGNQSLVKKNDDGLLSVLYLGGIQGSRVSSFSSYIFAQDVGFDGNEIWLEQLNFLKPNQITSHKVSECMKGSILDPLRNFR